MSFSSNPNVDSLVNEIVEAAKRLPADMFQDDNTRKRLQRAAYQLTGATEAPIDGVRKIIFQAQHMPVARVAIEGGWFDALGTTDTPKTAAELAKITGAEELLIVRLMRVLTAAGIVDEKGPQTYGATAITKALTISGIYHGLIHFADEGLPVWAEFPKYLVKNGFRVPTNPATGPFVERFGMTQWDYFRKNPESGRSFNVFMGGQQEGRGCWVDVYPLWERLAKGTKDSTDAAFFVDIAGCKGHDLRDVKDRIGTNMGRLVLEDLPEVIADVDDSNAIETIAYDFFTPQPIKGARAYFLRCILHDWDNESCRRLLANQAAAMEKGYSKLLVVDMVVPETNAPFFVAGMDIAMMAQLTGMERTRTQWHDLLESAGFRIVDIWPVSEGAECVIEAELLERAVL